MLTSSLTKQKDMEGVLKPWIKLVGGDYPFYRRKNWEYGFVAQSLYERGKLMPGMKGLVFGVGREPLATLFIDMGCQITATDYLGAKNWESVHTDKQLDKLFYPNIDTCNRQKFDDNIEFREVDMNEIPEDLYGKYDFVWSICAFEHLGTLENGMRFVSNSLKCLKPNGVAIHTAEFNVSSNEDTYSKGGTVLYRKTDLVDMAYFLTKAGYSVEPFDFDLGDMPNDHIIARGDEFPHLKTYIGKYISTCVGVIVSRKK